MSINQRQAKLLKILLGQVGYTRTVDISDALACSERTIRNDMRAANAFLDEMGIQAAIVSKRGNGIRIDGDSAQCGKIWLFGGFCGRDSGIGPAQRAKTTIWN